MAVLSGVFMVIMGLNMLNIFSALRKLNPRMPKIFARKVHENSGNKGPLIVGLLNGLMPCGPLQAMQIYALGTGSGMADAKSILGMFILKLNEPLTLVVPDNEDSGKLFNELKDYIDFD